MKLIFSTSSRKKLALARKHFCGTPNIVVISLKEAGIPRVPAPVYRRPSHGKVQAKAEHASENERSAGCWVLAEQQVLQNGRRARRKKGQPSNVLFIDRSMWRYESVACLISPTGQHYYLATKPERRNERFGDGTGEIYYRIRAFLESNVDRYGRAIA